MVQPGALRRFWTAYGLCVQGALAGLKESDHGCPAFQSRDLQMVDVTVPRELFAAILDRIQRFGVSPPLVQRS